MSDLSVVKKFDGWHVVDAGTDNSVSGPFETNALAWAWVDARDGDHQGLVDTHRRIGNAFSDR